MKDNVRDVLAAALSDKPWSLAGILGDFESSSDDEGRPLYEGRAPVRLREGVPMVMRQCPYPDARHERRMNVSALEQILAHLTAVERDIATFRSATPDEAPSWSALTRIVFDQTALPAIYLLERRSLSEPIPARLAVSYKVAVGYSKPVVDLLELDLRGEALPVSVEGFMAFVQKGRYLVGAREVCAAPTNVVERVTAALLAPCVPSNDALSPVRRPVASALALQIALGIAWRLFDRAVEGQLLLRDLGPERLHPRNGYLRRILGERMIELGTDPGALPGETGAARPRLPADLSPRVHEHLVTAMAAAMGEADSEPPVTAAFDALLDDGDGAIRLTDLSVRVRLARRFAGYLRARRVFLRTLIELEFDIRRTLGFPLDVPVAFDHSVFPISRALKWFELVSGYRFRTSETQLEGFVMRNQHRSVPLPLSAV